MRIGVISDLHIDRSKNYTLADFVSNLCQSAVDLLLIAGDISADHELTYRFICLLKEQLRTEVLFVPGNHDLWSEKGQDSWKIIDFFKDKAECLLGSSYHINEDWVIVGHCAWYDYSYASDEYDLTRLATGKFKGGQWQDKLNIDFLATDPEVSKYFAHEVRQELEKLYDKNIILMTHIVTHTAFQVPMPNRLFNFFNAYIGTSDFEAIYQDFNIRDSIMGHVHFRKQLLENNIHYICACLGYEREWRQHDLTYELAHTLNVIEV